MNDRSDREHFAPDLDAIAAAVAEAAARSSDGTARDAFAKTLDKARALAPLSLGDAAVLISATHAACDEALFTAAREIKQRIYGNRMVLFAPLYLSNRCVNDCSYCGFRAGRRDAVRVTLSPTEVAAQTRILVDQGHKRVLLVSSETTASDASLEPVIEAIDAIYATRSVRGEIRRVNVNMAPLSVAGFQRLKQARVGTYQLFQETYDPRIYAVMHRRGPKSDYRARLGAMDRAMRGGIDDVGLGVLFGLADFRFEVLALLQHARHLESRFGAGPHTVSVPRLEPAAGSDVASVRREEVADRQLLRIIAVLRLALPYTGLILSTREAPTLRRQALEVGISQLSAGSVTSPGGYRDSVGSTTGGRAATPDPNETTGDEQFAIRDHRSLDDVVAELLQARHLPSFCTACYRRGRTGRDFMQLAKPGLIRHYCQPNAMLTAQEYFLDHASEQTQRLGGRIIAESLQDGFSDTRRRQIHTRLHRLAAGERDLDF